MEIKVDKSIYSKQVLLKTAYSFSDRVYLHLSQNDCSWIIQWTNMQGQQLTPEMFENELISQQLREDLIEKTKDIRKLLLSRAFASSIIEINPPTTNASISDNIEVLSDIEDNDENAADILKGWFDL